MTHDNWWPGHCLHCDTYMGHDDAAFAPCPDECNHPFDHTNTGGGQYVCPTCGHNWQTAPPEDWDGSVLVRAERGEIRAPPRFYAHRLDESLLYAGRQWTHTAVFGGDA